MPFAGALLDEPLTKRMRAGTRVNSRVRVAVEWSEDGRNLRVDGHTLDVSAFGCLAVVPQGFRVGQRLRVINLTNDCTTESQVVWHRHENRSGWELGLQLDSPPMGFWGLDF